MANFSTYLPILQKVEGGFQSSPNDEGNFNSRGELVGTNFGISARFYEGIIGRPPSKIDMQSITQKEAKELYKIHFWDRNLGDQFKSQSVANTVIDHQINSGRGIKIAQRLLNERFGKSLAVDGIMGKNTLKAINSVNAKIFVEKYNEARADYYKSVGNQTFLNGWLIRLRDFAYSDAFALSTGFLVISAILGIIIYKNLS
jgi:lysozyme family protein